MLLFVVLRHKTLKRCLKVCGFIFFREKSEHDESVLLHPVLLLSLPSLPVLQAQPVYRSVCSLQSKSRVSV